MGSIYDAGVAKSTYDTVRREEKQKAYMTY